MGKTRVEEYLPKAYRVLSEGIGKNGMINGTFRGQIASFGASITMGSLLSAVAFFCADNKSTTDRTKLMSAIWELYKEGAKNRYQDVYEQYAKHIEEKQLKNKELFYFLCKLKELHSEVMYDERLLIVDITLSIKLAMNFFLKVDTKEGAAENV